MNKYLIIIMILIILILLNEFIQGLLRQKERKEIFIQAKTRSKNINKPLVVIGDPYYGYGTRFYGLFMDGYECGDETVDITGAPKCSKNYKMDILDYLKKQKNNSKVLFISCVLEYIDNIDEVISEIYRVAGSSNNIFIVAVSKYTLSAYLYQEDEYSAKNIIFGAPYYNNITYKKI